MSELTEEEMRRALFGDGSAGTYGRAEHRSPGQHAGRGVGRRPNSARSTRRLHRNSR